MKQIYDVLAEGWLEDAYRKVGDTVALTDVQAGYLVRAGIVALPKPKEPAKPAAK